MNAQKKDSFSSENNLFKANQWKNKAILCQTNTKIDSAISAWQYALDFYKKAQQSDSLTQCFLQLGKLTYFNLKKPKKAMAYYNSAIANRNQNNLSILKPIGQIYHEKGRTHLNLQQPDSAKYAYHQAIILKKKIYDSIHDEIAKSLNNLVSLLSGVYGDFPTAELYSLELIKMRVELFGEDYHKIIGHYLTLGNIYFYQKEFDKASNAFRFIKSKLEKKQQIGNLNKGELGFYHGTLINIGQCYLRTGNLSKAKKAFTEALITFRNLQEESDDNLAIRLCLYVLGEIYFQEGDFDRALLNFEKAYEMYRPLGGKIQTSQAHVLNYIGMCWNSKEDFQQAKKHYQLAIDEMSKTLDENHPDLFMVSSNYAENLINLDQVTEAKDYYLEMLAKKKPSLLNESTIYVNLGLAYMILNNYSLAEQYFKQALEIRQKLYSPPHQRIAVCYLQIAKIYYQKKLFKKALTSIQKSIAILLSNDDNISNVVISNMECNWPLDLIRTLSFKGDILAELYFESQDEISYLKKANETYILAVNKAKQARDEYKGVHSKRSLRELLPNTLSAAVETSFQLAQFEDNAAYLEKALQLAEMGKGLKLQEAFQLTKVDSVKGLSAVTIQQEKELKINLNYYENLLFSESHQETKDSSKINKLKDHIFQLKQTYFELLDSIKVNNPAYYNLRHQIPSFNLQQIQNELSNNQAIIEYFQGEYSIFAFVISKDSFFVKQIPLTFPLEESIQALRNGIYNHFLPEKNSSRITLDSANLLLAQNSELLYKLLISPLGKLPSQLIIIPDKFLGYLPFEILLTHQPSNLKDYKSYPFLLKDYQISYNYSIGLWNEMKNKDSNTEDCLTIAPSFPTCEKTQLGSVQIRGQICSLEYNQKEALFLDSLINATIQTGLKADKETFLKSASQFSILHFSTHAQINDEDTEFSWLAFTKTNDTTENKLYIKDLYNLNLPTQLVYLSACETGVGNLQNGEGIISLARGFSYAGAKSIITSLWKTTDLASYEIMRPFYVQLKNGAAKDEALRVAKLQYLQNHKDIDAHPFFWAAYIPIGDTSPLVMDFNKWKWQYLLIFSVISLLIFGLLLVKGKRY